MWRFAGADLQSVPFCDIWHGLQIRASEAPQNINAFALPERDFCLRLLPRFAKSPLGETTFGGSQLGVKLIPLHRLKRDKAKR